MRCTALLAGGQCSAERSASCWHILQHCLSHLPSNLHLAHAPGLQLRAHSALAVQAVERMRQGHGAAARTVDTGAMCLPGLSDKIARLVQEAEQQGAQVRLALH